MTIEGRLGESRDWVRESLLRFLGSLVLLLKRPQPEHLSQESPFVTNQVFQNYLNDAARRADLAMKRENIRSTGEGV